MISNIDQQGINFTGNWECKFNVNDPKWLTAYKDSGGLYTIGIGCIQYPNGQKVKMGDKITPAQRDEYFLFESRNKVNRVIILTRDDINQHQFNAVFDIAYNIGTGKGGLQTSKLLAAINKNLTDKSIINHFCSWRFDNGKFVPGLLKRRMSDAYLYFTGKEKYNWTEANWRTFSIKTVNEVVTAINKTA